MGHGHFAGRDLGAACAQTNGPAVRPLSLDEAWQVLEIVQSGIGGSAVSTLIDGTRRFDIAVRLAEPYRGACHHNLTAYRVKGSLAALDRLERHYSLDLGDAVINEYKLEFVCEDEDVDVLVAIIKRMAQTGGGASGWVYVVDVLRAEHIE